jgi:uncharacterized protein YbcI
VASQEAPSHRGEAAQAISNAVVRLLRDYTGRGPTQAYTTITESHVLIVLRDTLLKGERILVGDGHVAAVIDMRRRFQRTMREDLIAAVVEHTGREVAAFLSDHHVDPDIAVEVFILKPRSDGERAAARSVNGDGGGPEPAS